MSPGITMVIGASPKPSRYSHRAVLKLREQGHQVLALGKNPGTIGDVRIQPRVPEGTKVDTVSLYIHPGNQKEYYETLIALNPRRIIFNPGAENPELENLVSQHGIQALEACTLVLLSTGQYG